MKITAVEPILAGSRYLFVKVHTDEGLVGVGECGAWMFQRETAQMLKAFEPALIGQDPMRIEHIWNILSRNGAFRGSVIMAAVSGIDIALWDLKGKYFGVPCYELLGGKVREKIRIYVNVAGNTPEQCAASAKELKEKGFNAIRYRLPHTVTSPGRQFDTLSGIIEKTVEMTAAIRNAVGWDVDIALEAHRGLKPVEAIELGKALAPYRLFFYEDPVIDTPETMRRVIDECGIPVATGERLHHPVEFDPLLNTNVKYVRPDMCLAGGLTSGKKVSAMAEVKGIYIIPHNPLGPVSTAACLQLDACIPNFEAQEFPMHGNECRLDKEMKEPFVIGKGYVMIPEKPGLGIELIDDIDKVFPFTGGFGTRRTLHEDGSMVDR